jgi:hypothetical protein
MTIIQGHVNNQNPSIKPNVNKENDISNLFSINSGADISTPVANRIIPATNPTMSSSSSSPPCHAQNEPRSPPSALSVPFAHLPNPKRVWLGTPSSRAESLGRLALLTPSAVAAAAREEIRTGERVGLNWDMLKLEYSQFGRQSCRHEIVPLVGPGGEWVGGVF